MMNCKDTFDTYIVGEYNRKAYEAARLILQEEYCGVLFVTGAVGSGKSHLLNAISIEFEKQGKDVICTTGEEFCNDALSAFRSSDPMGLKNWRNRYKQAEVLIVDDIDFQAGKDATLSELLFIVDDYLVKGKQVITSSGTPVSKLDLQVECNKQLKSRLSGGIAVSMLKPKKEDKLKYLESLNRSMGSPLGREELVKLSREKTGDFRELAGKLKTRVLMRGNA